MTFGNAPELIIAFFALLEGLQEVVKASIVGSIIGNILLVMGAAFVVGGWSREKQTFSQTAASAQSGMLTLALAALVFPALFQLIHGGSLPGVGDEHVDFGSDLEKLSLGVALVLLASYVGRAVVLAEDTPGGLQPVRRDSRGGARTTGRSSGRRIYLALSAVAVGVMSEILVGSISEASEDSRPVASSSSASSSWRSSATRPSTGLRCSSRPRTRWTSR